MPVATFKDVEDYAAKIMAKINRGDRSMVTITAMAGGTKYVRLAAASPGSNYAYGFVELATGDVFKASSWKVPAKGVRGNIFSDDPTGCCTDYGMIYWTSGRKATK